MLHTQSTNKNFIHANFYVCFSLSFHYNALLGLITISNARGKRVNEYNQTVHMRGIKYVYIHIFVFVGVSIIEILLFNLEKKQQKKYMANL